MKSWKTFLAASAASLLSLNASAAYYGWENGATVLGEFDSGDELSYTNLVNAGAAHSGSASLLVEDLSATGSGTPQAYIAWVNGLTDGDTIDVSLWVFDSTPGASPSGRIWAHYTDDSSDVDSYAGSAGGNSTYSGAVGGWEELTYSWTFDSQGGSRDGFMLELRFYDGSSVPTGAILADDLTINTSSATASITFPGVSTVPVPTAAWLFGSALIALGSIGRSRNSQQ